MLIKILYVLQLGSALLSTAAVFSQTAVPMQSSRLSKQPISFKSPTVWPSVGSGTLSDDGKYVVYKYYSADGPSTLIIESTGKKWRHEFINGNSPVFADNSKLLLVKMPADTMSILDIESGTLQKIQHVNSFEINRIGDDDWLCYIDKTMTGDLLLKNLHTGKELKISNLINYKVCDNGSCIMVQLSEQHGSKKKLSLNTIDLEKQTRKEIWSAENEDLTIASYSSQNGIAFLLHNKSTQQNEIWYYDSLSETNRQLLNDSAFKDFVISQRQSPEFSKNRRLIYFGVEANPLTKPQSEMAAVDIWSYKDNSLQSIQSAEVKKKSVYTCSIDIEGKKLVRLEQDNERIIWRSNDFAVVQHELGNSGIFEDHWNDSAKLSFVLVNLANGQRKYLLNDLINPQSSLAISPGGKWALYYDFKERNFFSYELATGVKRNITAKCKTNWEIEANDKPDRSLNWVPWRNTWLTNDNAVFVYDNYDVWLIDPAGNTSPLNVTGGIGKAKKIKFELMFEGGDIDFSKGSTVFLRAANTLTKQNGFYTVQDGRTVMPQLRSMGPYIFGMVSEFYTPPPVKAKTAEQYLVIRMSAVEAPNYFVTNDFKSFRQITDLQPQKQVNWLKTELINWKGPDGRSYAGVLYKPENFNPNNKYPLIFDIYEKRSQNLNLFIYPEAAVDRINISSFVSNGYLVFTPDIYYRRGEPGPSALAAVVSAANYLTKFTWVDKQRMGIQGHSFGGYETNYIISHTNIFAAACSASGFCDLISFYGSAARGGYPIFWSERDQGRLGETIWDNPQAYIANSPIFQVKNITTPLLMMNNKEDRTVPFSQGLEFFTSLRRLGKKAWMLQYDGYGHSLGTGTAADDYHLRMFQFFNHYLKGADQPGWMKVGIPAMLKGYEDGL
jgi:dienelactone hydrolase